MRVLMFGKTGQVACDIARVVQEAGNITLIALDRAAADLTDGAACSDVIAAYAGQVDVVINAAAYTAVDKAETESNLAHAINGTTPGAMARACAAAGLPFLHVSTDYVFDGQGTAAWKPDDATGPLGVYGASKLDGEARIAAAGGDTAILRTSWVFSAHGANFVKTMLRLAETRDALTVVGDQIGGPTPAYGIAYTLITMARAFVAGQGTRGIYHYAGAPDVSWADFARAIFEDTNRAVTVTDIATSAYPTPAARPPNSRMDCTSLEAAFGIVRPDWREGLTDVLASLDK
ncbi:MAG: dTDP-4-dehydrorhamnose reductase [Gammaproteobacteria bacterium]|jgi:dTDP-4-dehydrorhamnose reductase